LTIKGVWGEQWAGRMGNKLKKRRTTPRQSKANGGRKPAREKGREWNWQRRERFRRRKVNSRETQGTKKKQSTTQKKTKTCREGDN